MDINAGMTKYILKRLIQAIPLLLVISLLTFAIVEIAPGDATQMYVNPERGADPEYLAQVRASLGLDRQAVIDAVAGGNGLLSDSVFNRSVFVYEEGRNAQYPYDPEQAQQLLADAGWTDSDGSDFLDKDGQEFTLRVVYSGTWSLMQGIAPIVYDNWRALGVNVELAPLDDTAINEVLYENTNVEKDYDAFLGGWGLFGPEPDHYRNYLADETGFFAYNNPDVIDLFTQGRSETDADARYALYEQADALLWQDLPLIPIFQPIGVYVYRSDLNLDAAEINGTFLTGLKFPGRAYFTQ
jgi:peptide/nickel transport system substrate-binding protein